jgi:hypothetical protein
MGIPPAKKDQENSDEEERCSSEFRSLKEEIFCARETQNEKQPSEEQ